MCRFRVILSLSLTLILLLTWAICPAVTAKALLTEITVVGGGALTLAALLDLLMVTFGASGMDGAVRNQAAATGTQTVPYIGQLLNRFLGVALDGIAPVTWAQPIQDGLSVLANGTLYLDSDATAAIADFQRWAWHDAGLSDYDPGAIDQSVATVNGVQLATGVTGLPSFVHGSRTYYTAPIVLGTLNDPNLTVSAASSEAVRVFACILESDGGVYMASSVSGVYLTVGIVRTDGTAFGASYGGGQQANSWIRTTLSDADGLTLPVVSALPAISDLSNAVIGGSTAAADPDTFVGPMQQGQGTQLPLGDVVTVSSDAGANLHLLNYLRAASAAYAGTGTADVPVTDVGTGEEELLPLSVPAKYPIGVTGVTDAAIDQSGAVAGTDAIAGDFAGTDAYTMDLTQFFPFCIPFDLYALYEKFESEAAAPVIDWPIPMPGGGDPLLVHLDFSAFDELAVWVRRLELIAFAVGLMIMTKQLIQGGD